MVRKINKYSNPFLKAKGPLAAPVAAPNGAAIPNLHEAVALHQQGMLDQAQKIYQSLLTLEPRNANALHLLGLIGYQTGDYQSAVDLIGQAIEVNPNDANYHSSLGLALQGLQELDAAVDSYDKAIVLKPDNAEAYFNRGLALQALKQLNDAVVSYDKAIHLKPDLAEAFSNRGLALQELQQLDAAIASYGRAIALKPNLVETHSNLGNALHELNQLDAALVSYDNAIALKPDDAVAYFSRGHVLKQLKHFEAAVTSFDKAITLNPDYSDAYSSRGIALQALKQLNAALVSYDQAIALKPDHVEAHFNRGNALLELKQLDAAVASYDKSITLKPDLAQAYSNRGLALQELKKLSAAVSSYDKALALKPDHAYLLGMKQHAQMCLCDWRDFDKAVSQLRHKIQNNEKVSPSFPVLALPISMADQRKAAEIWILDKHPYNPKLGPIPKKVREPKIRIGYYSAEFRFHPVSLLTIGLFEQHDKSKFELIAFSYGPEIKDEMRSRIASAFDTFLDVRAKSDEDVALLSRSMGIDIAIDLSGLTQDGRTGIFSYRASPIQLSYIGYLGTMGADYYDYLIADRTIIPVESQAHYCEKIVYLPSYQVNDSKQDIPISTISRQALNLPSSGFVYCCFNANYKITPFTFDGWMRILKAVPGSVLLLYTDIQSALENLKLEAAKRGVSGERLIFGGMLNRREYLARCKSADLFLDTLPYNAGATASDALWAGLPVLTCMGESFSSRVAASLLNAIDLPELVTQTQAEYEALAIELATSPTKLKRIKEKLEKNRLISPLFDTQFFAKNIEMAYTKMYERYQADLAPDHIYVTDVTA